MVDFNMHVRDRCIAMVDILGFRERLRAGKLIELAQLLDGLVDKTPHITMHWTMSTFELAGRRSRATSGRERMHKLLFSDTLLLWSDPMPASLERQQACADSFLCGVGFVISHALLNGLPLRAGIAYGQVLVHARKRIVIGQPVVDAYHAEGVQNWIGGAIHESYPRFQSSFELNYEVPVKPSARSVLTRALDWTMPVRVHDSEATADKKILPKLEQVLRSGIESAPLDAVRQKYANAAAFMTNVANDWERTRYHARSQ
jgi:hypothetical protein